MSVIASFEVELPIGFVDSDGGLHRRAALCKMTGAQEEMLYSPDLTASALVTGLLTGCLVSLGESHQVSESMVDALYVADRNYLLLELRRVTLGDQLRSVYECGACRAQMVVQEDLSQVAVRRLSQEAAPESFELELEDGWQDRKGTVHRRVRLRLPKGSDEAFVSRLAERDPWKARDAMLLRCIEAFGTLPRSELDAYGIKVLRELTLGDRQRLFRRLERDAPGVDFRRTLCCEACSARTETLLDTAAFFDLG